MEFSDRPLLRIAILGFNQAERIILASMFALSERRSVRYCQVGEEADPDILLIDGDNPHVIHQPEEIVRRSGSHVIFVGSSDFGLGVPLIHRPVSLATLFDTLDSVANFQRDVRVTSTASSVPVSRSIDPFVSTESPIANGSAFENAAAVHTGDAQPALSQPTVALDGNSDSAPGDCTTKEIGTAEAGTVLIVGASPTVLRFMRRHLTAMNCEVAVADHGEQAISMIQDSQFRCVFIEMNLVGIDPFSTCRAITRSSRLIVFLLGREPSLLDRIRGRLAGARGLLTKPLDAKTLAQAIEYKDGAIL